MRHSRNFDAGSLSVHPKSFGSEAALKAQLVDQAVHKKLDPGNFTLRIAELRRIVCQRACPLMYPYFQ